MLKSLLFVATGGAIGSSLRYLFMLFTKDSQFPYATLLVNILGSLLIGFLFALNLKNEFFTKNINLLLITGLCGGFTTFSAFSIENLRMIQEGKIAISLLYISLSIVGGLLATWLGYKIIIH